VDPAPACGAPLELHHGKHHATYVAGANATLEKLAAAREQRNFEAINRLQKNLAFHGSGDVLHSLFWRSMSPHGGGQHQNVKGDAVTAFWKVVNWEDVAQRLQKVRTLDLAL